MNSKFQLILCECQLTCSKGSRISRQNVQALVPFCYVTLTAQKPSLKLRFPPPLILTTWGDHILKRRMELKESRDEVGKRIGPSFFAIRNWENNIASPSRRYCEYRFHHSCEVERWETNRKSKLKALTEPLLFKDAAL